jgi:hypothetical protein
MSTISQRILRAKMPGYWAVEIRLSEAAARGKRYLVHAQDDRSAAGMAGRLMGSALTVRGFNYFWIAPDRLEQSRSSLPPLGGNQEVAGPEEWAQLMAAHHASERAAPERSLS